MSDFVTPAYRQSQYCEVAEGFNGAFVNFDDVVIMKLDHQSFRLEPLYDDDATDENKNEMLFWQADQMNIALRRIHEKAVKERDALKAENERLRGVIKDIAFQGTSQPAELNMPEGDWYKGIAFNLISTAAKALQGGEAIAHERGEG